MSLTIPVLLTRPQLQKRVKQLARQISRDYRGKSLVLVGVLKGVFIFMADLLRYLTIPVQCEFVMISSYGAGLESSGEIKLLLDISCTIKRKNVLIIEDIVDTGLTVKYLKEHLTSHQPKSLRVCTLLDKPSRRKVKVKLNYVGFSIPNKFVAGYGIDFNERYRSLPYVGYITGIN